MPVVSLAEGREVSFDEAVTVGEALRRLLPQWPEGLVGAKVNGQLVDLSFVISEDARLEPVLMSSPEGLEIMRHSVSHIMADAVRRLYPEARLAIGPPIEDGFYYDFDVPEPFRPEDLEKIEQKMREIMAEKLQFRRRELSREEALQRMRRANEPYKVELLEELTEEKVSFYEHGDFVDLCRGPHVPDTSCVGVFRLLKATGAYWRGDETRKMLQRIYGTAFATQKDLDDYLNRLEEAKKRDHRLLGQQMDLFSIHPQEGGPGLIYWHPKGAIVRRIMENFWVEEHLKRGYEIIYSPHIARVNLWEQSGHWGFYRENMYSPMDIDGQLYVLKPMNCPAHVLIYRSRTRSYRDLPLRWAELGTVYRYERSGVVQGMLRVRGFTQDDAHIFCRPDQLEEEVMGVIDFGTFILRTYGFEDWQVVLSTRPEEYVGTLENWELATNALKRAAEKMGLRYEVAEGEAVFYGPKVDMLVKDCLGRLWQCFTVQVDFNLPERFDIHYTGKDGRQHRPIMIHRALMGSLERFFAVLIEHYGGHLPLWLAPVQVRVIPITDEQMDYALQVYQKLKEEGFRVELEQRSEPIRHKIRDAVTSKVVYLAVVGEREAAEGTVSVRESAKGQVGVMSLEEFIGLLRERVASKK
jgi:threonyl-tRNA synthetase